MHPPIDKLDHCGGWLAGFPGFPGSPIGSLLCSVHPLQQEKKNHVAAPVVLVPPCERRVRRRTIETAHDASPMDLLGPAHSPDMCRVHSVVTLRIYVQVFCSCKKRDSLDLNEAKKDNDAKNNTSRKRGSPVASFRSQVALCSAKLYPETRPAQRVVCTNNQANEFATCCS